MTKSRESRSREELPLNCDRDPVRWADEFLKVVEVRCNSEEVLTGKEPLLDKGWLIGWFANAMMCGEDTYRWRLPRYSLSYTTPKGTRVRLFNLLESAVREIETVQKTLGSSDFRIEEQERPEDQFSMGDPHPCDMTAEERERAFAPSHVAASFPRWRCEGCGEEFTDDFFNRGHTRYKDDGRGNAEPVHCGPISLIQSASGTMEEAARRLEACAAAIEEAKRATMKPGEVFYDTEVSTLKAAAAILRRSDSRGKE